ncbi:MAG: MFS transporter [Gammaproteobacteria bacterium]
MNQFNLLNTKRFAPLFSTQFLGALNDNIYKNALIIFIAFTLASQADRNSSILVIIAAGLFILPFFLFSAIAGQIADKFEKSMLIRRIKIAEICIMLFAVIGFVKLSLPILMVVLFLMGMQSSLFGPLKYGILPQHLDESELTGGNGMIQMGTYLAILLGTILGGVLISIKPEGTYYVSLIVISVALCGWWASRYIPFAEPAESTLKINWNFITETWRIVHYARENRTVFWSIIAISWFWFYGATFLYLVPSYTRDVLNGNEHVTTLLLAAFSVGIGTGSLMCEKLSGKRIEMGLVPIGAVGLSIFAIDLFMTGVPNQEVLAGISIMNLSIFLQNIDSWRVLIDLSLIGMFGGIYIVPLYALVQNRCSKNRRSRIIAANNIINALFMVISALMTIYLLSVDVGITGIFLIVALLNVVVAVIVFTRIPEFFHRTLLMARLRQE